MNETKKKNDLNELWGGSIEVLATEDEQRTKGKSTRVTNEWLYESELLGSEPGQY